MSIINVIMTLVSLILVERAGRRTLHLFGLGGMCVTTIILAFCLALHEKFAFLSWVSIIAVFVFIIMFASGPGSIPWFLVSELFGAGARGIATSISVATNWAANFLVSLAFLPLKVSFGLIINFLKLYYLLILRQTDFNPLFFLKIRN